LDGNLISQFERRFAERLGLKALCECEQAEDLKGKHWKAKPILHGASPL
jgi:hypothetical protein